MKGEQKDFRPSASIERALFARHVLYDSAFLGLPIQLPTLGNQRVRAKHPMVPEKSRLDPRHLQHATGTQESGLNLRLRTKPAVETLFTQA
jgi:hypothetical protein